VFTDECDFTLEPLAAILTFVKSPTLMQRSRNTASVIIKCFTAWLELVAFPATDFCDALCGFSVHGALFGVSVAGLRMFSEMRFVAAWDKLIVAFVPDVYVCDKWPDQN